MNPPVLLFSSLSAKTALYRAVLSDARRFHPQARVIGADCDAAAPARHHVEEFLLLPRLDEVSPEAFAALCADHGVTHLVPTRDGELRFLAEAAPHLSAEGIHALVTAPKALEACLDKLLFAQRLGERGLSAIPTSTNLHDLTLPPRAPNEKLLTVKERFGSGSHSIGLRLTPDEAATHAANLRQPIFQPHVAGQEFSAETWLDSTSRPRGAVLRWREKVIDGESHLTTTFRHSAWESLVLDAAKNLRLTGHALAQVIVDEDERPHLVEINARLGGASPLSLHLGLHSIEWFLQETTADIPTSVRPPPFFRPEPGHSLLKDSNGVRFQAPGQGD